MNNGGKQGAAVKCLDCDTLIDPSPSGRGQPRVRCEKHRRERKAQLQRARTAQRRAEGFGVTAELVIAQDVFERDNWICYLCGEPVPVDLRRRTFRAGRYEPMYPVVDHVIPLARGGPHTMDNCRLAHWTCNAQKHIGDGLAAPGVAVTAGAPVSAPDETRRCSVEGCSRPAQFKAMCEMHYGRNRRFGHPLRVKCGCGCAEVVMVDPAWTGLFYIDGHGVQGHAVDPVEKLRRSQIPQPVSDHGRQMYGLTDDCLIWTGPITSKGYGVINIRTGKRATRGEQVHRFAYEVEHGQGSARGWTIDHLCAVALCCNPNHLEAVTVAENLRRAALRVTACPRGHPYDERNTLYSSQTGHRICRQCNRNRYHRRKLGHDFVLDPDNSSTERERCLTCRFARESTPQFCPYGHEYTPENTRRNLGKRSCVQCSRDRTHVEQFGHEFVIDSSSTSQKRRRCLICVQAAPAVTHCVRGHEYTPLTVEFSRKGHRKCVQCRLDNAHVPTYGHSFDIDPLHTGKLRRCRKCHAARDASS